MTKHPEKKFNKLLKKHSWLKDCITESASTSIMILSGGNANGIDKKILCGVFDEDFKICDSFFPKNETFSIFKFASISDSSRFFEKFNYLNVKLDWRDVKIVLNLKYLSNFDSVKFRLKDKSKTDFETITPAYDLKLDYLQNYKEVLSYCNSLYQKISNAIAEGIDISKEYCVSTLASRLAVHFNYQFDYTQNNVVALNERQKIPEIFKSIASNLVSDGVFDEIPDQLTINFYNPGDGIPSHVDVHSCFEDPIVSLSLNSGILMKLKNLDKKSFEIWLAPNSLFVMKGDLRYGWEHGISPRSYDVIERNGELETIARDFRVSLTFRRVKTKQFCDCSYGTLCDYKTPKLKERAQSKLKKTHIEDQYVKDVYESIADHFSYTRKSHWTKVKEFISGLQPNNLVFDIGCGNGKYMCLKKEYPHLNFIGIDNCFKLLDICRGENLEVLCGDALRLPFKTNTSNHTISIAVLHHISTFERRCSLISELIRVTVPSGTILISVWSNNVYDNKAMKQAQSVGDCQNDFLVPWTYRKVNDSKLSVEAVKYLRYIHTFSEEDLRMHLEHFSSSISVNSIVLDKCNWFAVVKKL